MEAMTGNPASAGQQGSVSIDALRANFITVRAWFTQHGEWSREDAAEVGEAIAQAVREDDAGMLAFWLDWLAGMAQAAREASA